MLTSTERMLAFDRPRPARASRAVKPLRRNKLTGVLKQSHTSRRGVCSTSASTAAINTLLNEKGAIAVGSGSKWSFTTTSTTITITVSSATAVDTCPTEVWLTSDATKQQVFTGTLTPGAKVSTMTVSSLKSGSYSLVVGGNSRALPAGCNGQENLAFTITVTAAD